MEDEIVYTIAHHEGVVLSGYVFDKEVNLKVLGDEDIGLVYEENVLFVFDVYSAIVDSVLKPLVFVLKNCIKMEK